MKTKEHKIELDFIKKLEDIVSPDVFKNSKLLREKQSFEREDGTPLYYTLVNIKDWCKNSFEVINQLKINTQDSFHKYDVIILINGLSLIQVELKTLEVSPKRAMEQIVDYKNDIGNRYTNTLLCFIQLFIVSNKTNTYYFANNDNKHFNFDSQERFLQIYQYADKKNYCLLNFEKQWESLGQGNTFTAIGTNDIKNLKILIPKSKQEQQKIADTLSSLDSLIEADNKKLDALKAHKNGLMQQIFVNEEV